MDLPSMLIIMFGSILACMMFVCHFGSSIKPGALGTSRGAANGAQPEGYEETETESFFCFQKNCSKSYEDPEDGWSSAVLG
jgi:hypothetical protein